MKNSREIDDLLRSAAQSGMAPGVVAMAANADELLYQGAFGRRSIPSGPPITVDTVFWIASMTKPITSTAAMLLVERQQLDLDRPLGNLMGELAAPQVLEGFTADGSPKLRPAESAITLRHLLTHTSGFGYEIWNPNLLRYQERGIPSVISCQNAALRIPLSFDPGTAWEYGIGIDWAGKAVERVSGQTLQEFFEENLFGPLNMRDTAFKLTPERRQRLTAMHTRQDNGAFDTIEFEIPQEPEFQMGGGGLYGTAGDYLAFQQMFLRGGRVGRAQLLRSETVRQMGQNQIGSLKVQRLRTAIPAYSNDAEFFPGMAKKWGLGFMLNPEPLADGRRAQSMAWAGLANLYFWIDPAAHLAGVMMTQLLPFFDPRVVALFNQFEQAIYA